MTRTRNKFYILTLAMLALLLACPLTADEEDVDDEDSTPGAIDISELKLSGMIDVGLQADSAEATGVGRHADTDSGSLALALKGRAASDLFDLAGIFGELGVGLDFGIMDAYVEDARPTVDDEDLFGALYSANIEFGVGAYFGPFTFSVGVMGRSVGALLEDHPTHYHDHDNDGFFEVDTFTLNYGYWASYFEVSLMAGEPGVLGGSGISLRYMPTVGFNFREGEDKTYGWQVRGQIAADFGIRETLGIFVELGSIHGDEDAGHDDVWWFQIGISAFFS